MPSCKWGGVKAEDRTVGEATTFSTEQSFDKLTVNADLTISANVTITVKQVEVPVETDGTAPQIIVEQGAKLVVSDNYIVKRKVKKNEWVFISMPTNFNAERGISASFGTTVSKKHQYPKTWKDNANSTSNSVWKEGSPWGATVKPAVDGTRSEGGDNSQVFAIAVKADKDDELTITGEARTFEGKDYNIQNVWYSGFSQEENMNFVGHPFTCNYTGVFKSSGASQRPNAQKGVITYQYDSANDIIFPNLVMDEPATYKPYDAFFSQCYEALQAPLTPVTSAGGTYNVTNRFSLKLGNDRVRFVEMTGEQETFDQNIDALKMFGLKEETPAVYTYKGDDTWRMSAIVVPTLLNRTNKVGVKLKVAGEYTFTAADLKEDYRLVLTDTKTNTTTVLKDGGTYTFTVDEEDAGYINDRFTVVLVEKLKNTGTEEGAVLTGAFLTDDYNALFTDKLKTRYVDLTAVSSLTTSDFITGFENCLFFVNGSISESLKAVANVVVKDGETCQAANIVLNDGSDSKFDFKNPYAFTAGKVQYNRAFTADKKATVFLPFAPKAEDGTYYAYSKLDGTTVHFESTDAPAANTPYLFVPGSDLTNITVENVTVEATPEQATSGFIGVYQRQGVPDGSFGFQNDAFGKIEGSSVNISAFRAYLKIEGSDAKELAVVLTDPAEETDEPGGDGNIVDGISSVRRTGEAGQPMYNLAGQRVGNAYKGIVIVNGRKYANVK